MQAILSIVALYFTYKLINSVLTSNGPDELNSQEKKTVLLTTFFDPIIAGAFYYYTWKNKFPKKASQSNKYSWLMLGVWLVIYLPIVFMASRQAK